MTQPALTNIAYNGDGSITLTATYAQDAYGNQLTQTIASGAPNVGQTIAAFFALDLATAINADNGYPIDNARALLDGTMLQIT